MWYQTLYNQQQQKLPGANVSWLAELRNKHMLQFAQQGFPSRQLENWKYTDLSRLNQANYSLPSTTDNATCTNLVSKHIISKDYYQLVFVDGKLNKPLSSKQIPNNITITDLPGAIAKQPELIQNYLGKAVKSNTHTLVPFNTAMMYSGIVLHIPDNVHISKPIHCLFISTKNSSPSMYCYRNVVIVGENSQLDLIEHYVGDDNCDYLTNSIMELFAQTNSRTQHIRCQLEGNGATHLSNLHLLQQQNSHYTSYNINLAGLLERYDIHSQLNARNTHCDLYGLYIANQQQHIDNHIQVSHQAPLGNSKQFYKGLLTDHSRGVFNGKVLVTPDAQQTDAKQSNHNLLLSSEAEIDTKPELEIYADNVKCSHGATVGDLNAQALFYLRSRGISKADAQLLLINAFVHEIVKKIPLPAGRDYIQGLVSNKLKTISDR